MLVGKASWIRIRKRPSLGMSSPLKKSCGDCSATGWICCLVSSGTPGATWCMSCITWSRALQRVSAIISTNPTVFSVSTMGGGPLGFVLTQSGTLVPWYQPVLIIINHYLPLLTNQSQLFLTSINHKQCPPTLLWILHDQLADLRGVVRGWPEFCCWDSRFESLGIPQP